MIAERVDPGMTPTETVTAYDVWTSNLVWQQTVPANSPISSSGNLVTAGDIVVQGTSMGEVYVFDARTGDELFFYKASRPIRASPLTYEVNSKQYISFIASNTVLTLAVP